LWFAHSVPGSMGYEALLVMAFASMMGAGVAHFRHNARVHQLLMVAVGVVALAFSIYLWVVGGGFTGGVPAVLGRVGGVAFGVSIILWQASAYRDREGVTRRCNVAAGFAAALGVGMLALNLLNGATTPDPGLRLVAAAAWPMCMIGSATLAAISR